MTVIIHSENPRAKASQFKPFAGNARVHPPAQLKALAAAIAEKGFASDLLVDEAFEIIAGHGRFEAGKLAGMTHFPYIMAKGWTEKQKAEARIADNAIPLLAQWNGELLKAEFGVLQAMGSNLESLGFTPLQLGEFGAAGYEPTEVSKRANKAPPVPKDPVVKLGELWHLGEHRVFCGDSTSDVDCLQLLAGVRAPLLHADPPYGMGKENVGVQNDNLYREKLDAFQWQWWHAWRGALAENGSAYIWGQAEDLWRFYWHKLEASERMTFRNEITWPSRNR